MRQTVKRLPNLDVVLLYFVKLSNKRAYCDMIDESDRRILNVLQRDAAMPLDALGDEVGLSRNAVWRRIKTLEADGIIRGRVALLDAEALDLGLSVYMQVRTNAHSAEWSAAFAKAIWEIPEILSAARMTGDLDYLVHARVRDMKHYDRLYRRLTKRVEMSDVSASFVMEELKDTTALPLAQVI